MGVLSSLVIGGGMCVSDYNTSQHRVKGPLCPRNGAVWTLGTHTRRAGRQGVGEQGDLSRMVRDGREGSMGEKIHREVQETARVRDDDISGQDGGRRDREEEHFEMVRPGD